MNNGKKLCITYYRNKLELSEDACLALYYAERDYWDHMAKAAEHVFSMQQKLQIDQLTK